MGGHYSPQESFEYAYETRLEPQLVFHGFNVIVDNKTYPKFQGTVRNWNQSSMPPIVNYEIKNCSPGFSPWIDTIVEQYGYYSGQYMGNYTQTINTTYTGAYKFTLKW
jgi:hypothetical protein